MHDPDVTACCMETDHEGVTLGAAFLPSPVDSGTLVLQECVSTSRNKSQGEI